MDDLIEDLPPCPNCLGRLEPVETEEDASVLVCRQCGSFADFSDLSLRIDQHGPGAAVHLVVLSVL